MSKRHISNFLFEAPVMPDPAIKTVQPPQPDATNQPQNVSLDAKVDGYLLQYERESAPQAGIPPVAESSIRKRSFMNLLFEADDLDPLAAGDDANGGDAPDDPSSGGGDDDPLGLGGGEEDGGGDGKTEDDTPPPPPPGPRVNIRLMASRVARLVGNYEALLDPKTVILNRVYAYMQQNYDANVAAEMANTLALTYNLKPRVSASQQASNQAPAMSGAGVGDLSANPSSGGAESGV